MVRRALRPSFSRNDQTRLMQALRDARHLALIRGESVGFGSEQHVASRDLKDAIDRFAQHIMGDSEYFWTPLHSTPENV